MTKLVVEKLVSNGVLITTVMIPFGIIGQRMNESIRKPPPPHSFVAISLFLLVKFDTTESGFGSQ